MGHKQEHRFQNIIIYILTYKAMIYDEERRIKPRIERRVNERRIKEITAKPFVVVEGKLRG